MEIILVPHKDRKKWNHLIESAPAFSLMQTYEWGEFKEAEGWKAYRLALMHEDQFIGGAQVLIRPILKGLFSIAYIPRGPLSQPDDAPALNALFPAIHRLARRFRSIFLKIEPYWEDSQSTKQTLEELGFLNSCLTNQPRASIIVDLTQEPEEILRRMQRSTRYNIKLASRKGVIIHEGAEKDLPTFYELLNITAERNNFPIRSFDYYKRQWEIFSKINSARLLLAKYQDKTIGARLVLVSDKKAADLHAASSAELAHLKSNYLLVWEAMMWAKARGCYIYDLWGIPDEVGELTSNGKEIPDKSEGGLWGVYQFKRGFGGKVVYYTGAYDYVYYRSIYKPIVKGYLSGTTTDHIVERFSGI